MTRGGLVAMVAAGLLLGSGLAGATEDADEARKMAQEIASCSGVLLAYSDIGVDVGAATAEMASYLADTARGYRVSAAYLFQMAAALDERKVPDLKTAYDVQVQPISDAEKRRVLMLYKGSGYDGIQQNVELCLAMNEVVTQIVQMVREDAAQR